MQRRRRTSSAFQPQKIGDFLEAAYSLDTIDLPDSAVAALRQASSQMPADFVIRSVRTDLVQRSGRALASAELKGGFRRMAALGAPDCLTINGLDPEGRGTMMTLWLTDDSRIAGAELATYRRMAQHLAAANRCRRRLREAHREVTDGAEAILDARLRIVPWDSRSRRPRTRWASPTRRSACCSVAPR